MNDAITAALVSYAAASATTPLPPTVEDRASLHLLDTIGAIVSGTTMPAGIAGRAHLAWVGDRGDYPLLGTSIRASFEGAALANGMSAHADETDDSHEQSTTHPGCGIVPAALVAAQRAGSSGAELLRAIALGYDVGTRLVQAIGDDAFDLRGSRHASHAFGPMAGAAFACGSLLGFDGERFEALTSFLAQELSGITTWQQDPQHELKAYVFGGMPASTGARLASMVASGIASGGDVLGANRRNMLDVYGTAPRLSVLVDDLGTRFAIAETNIKRFAVGSPNQAVVQAVLSLVEHHAPPVDAIEEIRVHLHPRLADVVDANPMPSVSCQYCVAVAITDGSVGYETVHDAERMAAPDMVALMGRVKVVRDRPDPVRREAEVEVQLKSGELLSRFESRVLGTHERPMSRDQVNAKVIDLLAPSLGADGAVAACEATVGLPDLPDVRMYLPLFSPRD